MRRVYYAFALRLALHPATISLLVFMTCLYALAKLVFVARVVDSLLSVPVRELVPHTFKVLSYADLPTLAVFTVCVVALVFIAINIKLPKIHDFQVRTT